MLENSLISPPTKPQTEGQRELAREIELMLARDKARQRAEEARREEARERRIADPADRGYCRCDGGEVHGHCVDCNTHLAEGMQRCDVCQERLSRTRRCTRCGVAYLVPPKGESVPWWMFHAHCTKECFQEETTRRLKDAGLPSAYLDRTLENFDAYTPTLKSKLAKLRAWLTGPRTVGLFFRGGYGCGKSHLASAVMREMLDRGVFGKYVNARTFVMRCQDSFHGDDNKRATELVRDLLRSSFLVLDDLGTVKPTQYAVQMLTDLVDMAYVGRKLLIVTSNKTLDDLVAIDGDLGVLASRLVEMCELFEFHEPDYRVRISKRRAAALNQSAAGGAR